MNPREANQIALKLKGHFQKMTDEQVGHWAEKFEAFDVSAARKAVEEMADTREEFSTPALLAILRRKKLELEDPGAARGDESARWRAEAKHRESRIARMKDGVLALLAREAIAAANIDPDVRKTLQGRRPRTSGWIKALVIDWLDAPKGLRA